MKVSPRDINKYLKTIDPSIRAVLIFGKDDGLIRERRDTISKNILNTAEDPFAQCNLTTEQIAEDPAKVADEMGAVSMMGGRRLVRINGANDKCTEAIKNALNHESGDSLLLVSAGDLNPRSSLRKFFENEKTVLTIACYSDTSNDLDALVSSFLRENNIKAEREVVIYLTQHLGNDRIVTRMELEKIFLFLGGNENNNQTKTLSLDDVKQIIADASSLTLTDISAATTGSDLKKLGVLLDKASRESIGAIEILRIIQFRLQQFHLVRGQLDEGIPLNVAIGKLRPPLFFKDKDVFTTQIRNWPLKRLASALNYTIQAEARCKMTNAPDIAIAKKTCMDICLNSKKSL